jgi:hypothetical protein
MRRGEEAVMKEWLTLAMLTTTAVFCSAQAAADETQTTQQKAEGQKKAERQKAERQKADAQEKADARKAQGQKTEAQKTEAQKTEKEGAVDEANRKAGEDAAEANRTLVGEEKQKKNEMRARDPKNSEPTPEERRKADAEARQPAQAIGRATTTAAVTIADAAHDATRATDRPGKYNPFAIALNPLGLFVGGRVSLNLEYAPVTHHVIVVSPHIVSTSAEIAQSDNRTANQTFSGAGGEVGYRYYTGHRGMNGVFVGPSLIGGVYNANLPSGNDGFTNIGVAADVGVQQVFWDHLVLGGGLGVEYLSVSEEFHDLPAGPSTIASSGVKPRFLASAGYAF